MGKKLPGFLRRTDIYGFELFMALFGLVVTTVIVDYGLFSIFNYLQPMSRSADMGDLTLWVVAAVAVWLPVTILFYLRSRGEGEANPLQTARPIHKVFVSIYFFVLIVGMVGLVFGALYSLIMFAVNGEQNIGRLLYQTVTPALLAGLFHVGMLFAYSKTKKLSASKFATAFGVVALVVAVMLLVV